MTLDKNKLKKEMETELTIPVRIVRALLAELEAAEQQRDKWQTLFYESEEGNCSCNIADTSKPGDPMNYVCEWHEEHPRITKAREVVLTLANRAEAAEERVRELTQHNDFLQRREKHFAEALAVADGGKFRNDWDARIQSVIDENKRLSVMETALRNAFVIIEGLNISIEWELAPEIKKAIAESSKEIMKALSDQGGNNGCTDGTLSS